jgi:hypothetical protein
VAGWQGAVFSSLVRNETLIGSFQFKNTGDGSGGQPWSTFKVVHDIMCVSLNLIGQLRNSLPCLLLGVAKSIMWLWGTLRFGRCRKTMMAFQ